MRKERLFFGFVILGCLGAGLVFAQVQTQRKLKASLPPLPDLVARIDSVGTPIVVGTNIEVPLTVTVQNAGSLKAGVFKVSISFEVTEGGRPGLASRGDVPFTVPGQADRWRPLTSGELSPRGKPRDSETFGGRAVFDRAYGGTRVNLIVTADSTAGDELMPSYGRVQESSEGNNTAAREINLGPEGATGTAAALGCSGQSPPGYFRQELTQFKFVETRTRHNAYAVTLVNNGTAPTAELNFTVEYEITRGSKPLLPPSGQIEIPPAARRGAALAPRERRQYEIPLSLSLIFAGLGIKFRTRVDSPGGTTLDGGSFRTPWSSVRSIPKVEIRVTTDFLRAVLAGKIDGSIRLNNFAGPTSDFQLDNEPIRRNDSSVVIGQHRAVGREDMFTPQLFPYEVGVERYWFYCNDLNGTFGEPDSFAIKDGKFMITIKFETGGGPEIRGWVFVRPYWYDTPPDFKFSKFELYIYLTPMLHDGKISYSGVGVGMDLQLDLAHSVWRGFDRVLGATIGTSILESVRRSLPPAIQAEVLKQLDTEQNRTLFETEVENSLREQIRAALGELALALIPPLESIRGEGGAIIITLGL
jgi:hypothetical protein